MTLGPPTSYLEDAVIDADRLINEFIIKHGQAPKGIRLGFRVFAELVRRGRIKPGPGRGYVTDRPDVAGTAAESTWLILDNTTIVEVEAAEWVCLLPSGL